MGLPVIASNCSGNADIIHDNINGRLFPVQDIKRLENIMVELMNDPEQRNRLSENAKTITQKYSPENVYGLWNALL